MAKAGADETGKGTEEGTEDEAKAKTSNQSC